MNVDREFIFNLKKKYEEKETKLRQKRQKYKDSSDFSRGVTATRMTDFAEVVMFLNEHLRDTEE